MKAVYVDGSGDYNGIMTVGKTYEVQRQKCQYENYVTVVDDNGRERSMFAQRFKFPVEAVPDDQDHN